MSLRLSLFASLALFGFSHLWADDDALVIRADKPGAEIQPTMYGIFFEDINYAADGGLYAELVQNRSFEYPNAFAAWDISGAVSLRSDGPFERCPHYLRLASTGHGAKPTMVENHGFFGIPVSAGADYEFSVWARCPEGGEAHLRVDVSNPTTAADDQCLATAGIHVKGSDWQRYTATLHVPTTEAHAALRVWGDASCVTDVEHVSLFPADVCRLCPDQPDALPGGLRRDLVDALADLHPGVFRFPGGCIVEGADLATRYQWKNTLGPVENRPLNENRWHYTFSNRYFPDYFQSLGLGFFEFFCLSEHLGAEPLPVLSVGLACQYQNNIADEAHVHASLDDLDPYIQDCIDLIDFANADPATNEWASRRAAMGHPEPFNLRFLALGNEQWDYPDNPAFTARLQRFVQAIRAARPEVQLIGSTGPDSEGEKFDDLQQKMIDLGCDLYDEHYYRNEAWFLDSINRHRYDAYPRKIKGKAAPRVFAGEYACHGDGRKYNHFNAALLEAQFMTGFERNADLVHMATYAPLFARVEGWQWRPDAIWFDGLGSVRTSSYYVQQLYAQHRGDRVLPVTYCGTAPAGDAHQHGISATASAVYRAAGAKEASSIIVKVANVSDAPRRLPLDVRGLKRGKRVTGAEVTTLHADSPTAENTLATPDAVVPVTSRVTFADGIPAVTLPAQTFAVIVLDVE